MTAVADGWHELVDVVAPGTRYAYRIDGELTVPDPASRSNPVGVHGASEVIDPRAFDWRDGDWRGRPWNEAVIYEAHVGTISATGDFRGLEARLDAIAALGITAIELMPLATFSGRHGWGYDGALLYAPHSVYGPPDDLKRLVQAAHARGLMMILDVVYNHFGPDGNFLGRYAKTFFNPQRATPWGDALNLDGEGSATVRAFFIENALYWLEEYHFDGLRVDAVHALHDESDPSLVQELCRAVQEGPGRSRTLHVILENHDNDAGLLLRNGTTPRYATAQWNDDFHHAFHVILTGERNGYYADYADDPHRHLGRTLAEGFAYQGEVSGCSGQARGTPSRDLPPTAFVTFLQNHDQIGNRAGGDRLATLASPASLRAAFEVLLLAPSPPMLFMGEETGATVPFLYFCDYPGELGDAITSGRRREFRAFEQFASRVPDPNAEATFERSRLPTNPDGPRAESGSWSGFLRELLVKRREHIVPLLSQLVAGAASYAVEGATVHVVWPLDDGRELELIANLSDEPSRRGGPWQVRWLLGGTEL